ncbi:hypothetical protein Tco_0750919 [Tanacetum coccineum]|uniref:Uncharacterized protein n=1 Tax=Tanacetum coccineum TaxID=301880 RepID=A0ABQ4Z622_9ASTR
MVGRQRRCGWSGEVMERVRESGYGDRIDRVVRSIFGVGRKTPPENFSGGGGGGRIFMREREEGDEFVYVSPKPVLLSLKHAQLPVLGSTRMYRDLSLPTSGPK